MMCVFHSAGVLMHGKGMHAWWNSTTAVSFAYGIGTEMKNSIRGANEAKNCFLKGWFSRATPETRCGVCVCALPSVPGHGGPVHLGHDLSAEVNGILTCLYLILSQNILMPTRSVERILLKH